MSNTQPPLDFDKIELLRKHMMLTIENMCTLFGVTRMTYYGWLKGKPPRPTNDLKIRRVLKQLLHVMTEHSWPYPDVIAMDRKARFAELLALITPQETEESEDSAGDPEADNNNESTVGG